MTAQRYVLVVQHPTTVQKNVGANIVDPPSWDIAHEMYERMCAATPIAADDPAEVERVARMLQRANRPDHGMFNAEQMDEMDEQSLPAYRKLALAVLRLFTPAGRPERT